MKISVELSEEQLALLINALEINFRMMKPNQAGYIVDFLYEVPNRSEMTEDTWKRCFERYITSRDDAKIVLDALSKIIYGEYSDSVKKECNRLCDMWSALRHLQYQLHPNNDGYDVRSRKPIQISDYKMIKVELMEQEDR